MPRVKFWIATTLAATLFSQASAQEMPAVQDLSEEQPQYERLPSMSLGAEAKLVVQASNRFSLELFRAAGPLDVNSVLSPASVSFAAGFAYRGAMGQTADELRKVLHYPHEPIGHLRASRDVMRSLELSANGREMHAANAFWIQTGLNLDVGYEADLVQSAEGALNRFDFRINPEGGREQVNSWVGKTTRGKIPELLPQGSIMSSTRAVLVNALYFKAQWANPFPKQATIPSSFKKLDGTKAQVELMNLRSDHQAIQRGKAKGILIPYVGGEFSLAVLMPDDARALPEFEAKLDPQGLDDWFKSLDSAKHRDTILHLPRFSLKWNGSLAHTIKAMGAPTPFGAGADFSGMARYPQSAGDPRAIGLYISDVIHGATFDIDEKGSEATAATAVIMGEIVISGQRSTAPPPPPFIFRADKPFLFMLRDNRTGLILFIGRYTGPSAT